MMTEDNKGIVVDIAEAEKLWGDLSSEMQAEFTDVIMTSLIEASQEMQSRIADLEIENKNLEAQPAAKWQPMETAPRDETKLLLSDGKEVFFGYFVPVISFERYQEVYGKSSTLEDFNAWESDMRISPVFAYDEWELFDMFGNPSEATPTHWMPIPHIPEENE